MALFSDRCAPSDWSTFRCIIFTRRVSTSARLLAATGLRAALPLRVRCAQPDPTRPNPTQPNPQGVEESLEYLRKVWEEQGPFDGLLGFSQGAAMASVFNHCVFGSGAMTGSDSDRGGSADDSDNGGGIHAAFGDFSLSVRGGSSFVTQYCCLYAQCAMGGGGGG